MQAMQLLEVATNAITTSNNAYEMCRNFVHTDFPGARTLGAQLVVVDQRGFIRETAHYGKVKPVPEDSSVWDDSPLASAIASKTIKSFKQEENFSIIFPFYKTLAPVGALILTTDQLWEPKTLDDVSSKIFAQLGAFYMDTTGLAVRTTGTNTEANPDELSSRQKEILLLISNGLTNAEIARELMLSESTIRQETVRIYRSLAVGSRSEAAKKGKALGVIPG